MSLEIYSTAELERHRDSMERTAARDKTPDLIFDAALAGIRDELERRGCCTPAEAVERIERQQTVERQTMNATRLFGVPMPDSPDYAEGYEHGHTDGVIEGEENVS